MKWFKLIYRLPHAIIYYIGVAIALTIWELREEE